VREIVTGEEFWSTHRLLKRRQGRVVVMTNEGLWAQTESLIRECANETEKSWWWQRRRGEKVYPKQQQ
jgi:hypothetical protein